MDIIIVLFILGLAGYLLYSLISSAINLVFGIWKQADLSRRKKLEEKEFAINEKLRIEQEEKLRIIQEEEWKRGQEKIRLMKIEEAIELKKQEAKETLNKDEFEMSHLRIARIKEKMNQNSKDEKEIIKEKILERKLKRKLEKEAKNELIQEGKIPGFEQNREPIPQDIMDKVWNRDQGKCVQCGTNQNLEFDHIIPFSKGGANSYRNLQLLCRSCNAKKSDKIG